MIGAIRQPAAKPTSLEEITSAGHDLLNHKLFDLAGTPMTLASLLTFLVIVIVTLWMSRLSQRAVAKFFQLRGVTDEGALGVTNRLVHYTVMLVGLGIGLDTLGFNLAALFAAGAVFAVAIGFALQNITQNFVSGVLLLVERTIKPGDVLELEGRRVKVMKMGIRTTIVRTKDEEDLIVPNSNLVSATVKNYTLRDPFYRVRILVGVVYSSDMRQVVDVLRAAAESVPWRSQRRGPEIFMKAFGASSVDFEVSVWIEDPWIFQKRISDLHQVIWWALIDADITIAFPQLDLHLDPEVVARLGAKRDLGQLSGELTRGDDHADS